MSAKKYLLGMLIVPALFAGTAFAFHGDYISEGEKKAEAYSVDDRGEVYRNSYGECWRTSYWTPELAIKECDPHLFNEPDPVAEIIPAPDVITTPEKITFSADALFDFDSSNLKHNGEVALDSFISNLEGVQYDLIIAVGYADRIGDDEYNKKLSVRRAESVKEYLVSGGVDPNRVFTDGKGEANPATGNTCQGDRRSQELIDCLASDRRVEVEVAVTR